MNPVTALLKRLLSMSEEAVSLLEKGDPAPEDVASLMAQRDELFAKLQAAVDDAGSHESSGDGEKQKQMAARIVSLDRRCHELITSYQKRLRDDLGAVKLQQRTLTAYGWVDPKHGPRGGFIDITKD